MKIMRIAGIAASALGAMWTLDAAERLEIADGDAKLQGPVGEAFERVVRNHVAATDPVYLTECYHERTETGCWQTEFWGKWMHSAAPFWKMNGCPLLKQKIDAGIANLLPAQEANGYLGNYAPECRSSAGSWDVWGVKYTLLGLLHYYDVTGDTKTLAAAKRLCDYLIGSVGPGAKLTIGGTGNFAGQPSCSVLEPVVWLSRRVKAADGEAAAKRYADFAAFIVREMTEREDGPRLLDLALKGVPVADRSAPPKGPSVMSGGLTNRGKAYEMMSCYQGLLEYALDSGRTDLVDAAVASARNIAAEEINLAGSGASNEHWYHGAKHQHQPFMHTQETCVTITWMRLCEKLLAVTGDPFWADQFERTFYNAYLASMSRDGSRFAAYTPLDGSRSDGHVHCRMHTNCCNMNGPRGFLSFIRSIAQSSGDEVFLNYYVSSRFVIDVPALGTQAKFEVHTFYPQKGAVDVRLRIREPMRFRLSLRMPESTGSNRVTVNGEEVAGTRTAGGGYCTIEREWRPGDAVNVDFDLVTRVHRLDGVVAFTRGPVLLARDSRFRDGELGEVVRLAELGGRPPVFELERATDGGEMRMVASARLPMGGHAENQDGMLRTTVRFCDYASAGNLWRSDDFCRVWLPVERNTLEAFPSDTR